MKKPKKVLQQAFLDALASGLTVTGAIAATGVPMSTAYSWRDRDREFAERWQEAVYEGTDVLEDEAFRRAVDGVKKPIYQGGVQVGEVTEYSDALLIELLKGRRPERYKNRTEVSGPSNQPLAPAAVVNIEIGQLDAHSDIQLAQLYREAVGAPGD